MSVFKEISGPIAIEFQPQCYMKALDNGQFILGGPHEIGIADLFYFKVIGSKICC